MQMAPLAGFDSAKAAQVAAFFVAREPHIEKLKLIKLVYLAERRALSQYGRPMLYDEFYSLKDGPICSSTLNGINGELDASTWSSLIALDSNGRNVHPVREVGRDDLDEVSDAEMDVLESVWAEFKDFTSSQIRNWTHKHCPEYTEVEKGRVPISYADVLKALGDDYASAIESDITAARRAASFLDA